MVFIVGLFLFLLCLTIIHKNFLVALCMIVIFPLGGILLQNKITVFQTVYPEDTYLVSGAIQEKYTSGNYLVFQLDDLTFNGEKVDGSLILYLTEYEDFDAFSFGERLTFKNYVSHNTTLSQGEFYATAVVEDTRYRAFADAVNIDKNCSILASVRQKFYDTLFDVMDHEEASVAYAMLFGDTHFIEDETLQAVRYGGIAHIFAVSGLHIGILYGAVEFLFRRRRAKPLYPLLVSVPVLFLYVAVCGFSPSSMRAFFMCVAVGVYRVFGLKYDGLESLGFAAGAVLCIQPVYLFSAGFQLSVLAVLGIFTLSPVFEHVFNRFPKPLVSALAITLSTELAMLPVLTDTFGYVSPVSLLLNLVFIPLVTPVFLLLLCTAVLGTLVPVLSGGLLFPALILKGFLWLVKLGDFSRFLVCGVSFGALALIYALLFAIASGKFRLHRPVRYVLSVLCCVVLVVGFCTANPAAELRIVSAEVYGTRLYLVRTNAESVLVADGRVSKSAVSSFLFQNGVIEPNVLLLPEGSSLSISCDAGEVRYGAYESSELSIAVTDGIYLETQTMRVAVDVRLAPADYYLHSVEDTQVVWLYQAGEWLEVKQ